MASSFRAFVNALYLQIHTAEAARVSLHLVLKRWLPIYPSARRGRHDFAQRNETHPFLHKTSRASHENVQSRPFLGKAVARP